MSTPKYSPGRVSEQPKPAVNLPGMDLSSITSTFEFSEKASHHAGTNGSSQHHGCEQCDIGDGDGHAEHRRCHNVRLRRFLLPFLIAFVLFGGLFALSCVGGHGLGDWGLGDLVRRAAEDGTNSNSPFVNNKLYLIVIFVGLFVVVILAIMLSAWCCKGAFENPLCCPCYLCACCGGLACLECIGCGLCAEGIDQM